MRIKKLLARFHKPKKKRKQFKPFMCSAEESHKKIELPIFNKSVRVRFGAVKKYPKRDIEFPSRRRIMKCGDKVAMKEIFIRHGVRTPEIVYVPTIHDRGLVYKKRKRARAEGMKICYSLKQSRAAFAEHAGEGYFERLVNSMREFRVHVMDGHCFYVDEKVPRTKDTPKSIIKNLDNGYKYREPKTFIPLDVVAQSVKAVVALGLEFGAVDVCVDAGGKAFVFEVNSAMGLRSKTRRMYEEELTKLIIKKGAKAV